MEKGDKNERAAAACKIAEEADLFLKWGNRKRLRCVRVRDKQLSSSYADGRLRRRITSRFLTFPDNKHPYTTLSQSTRLTRNSEAATHRSEKRKSSPEKDDKHYSTRGSGVGLDEKIVAGAGENGGGEESKSRGAVWPKLYISLSSKEKEEDFMAMKGCKLPQRPKKRAKIIQRTLLVSYFLEFCYGKSCYCVNPSSLSPCDKILMAAGDTFRAAASDQLEIWAERTGCV